MDNNDVGFLFLEIIRLVRFNCSLICWNLVMRLRWIGGKTSFGKPNCLFGRTRFRCQKILLRRNERSTVMTRDCIVKESTVLLSETFDHTLSCWHINPYLKTMRNASPSTSRVNESFPRLPTRIAPLVCWWLSGHTTHCAIARRCVYLSILSTCLPDPSLLWRRDSRIHHVEETGILLSRIIGWQIRDIMPVMKLQLLSSRTRCPLF